MNNVSVIEDLNETALIFGRRKTNVSTFIVASEDSSTIENQFHFSTCVYLLNGIRKTTKEMKLKFNLTDQPQSTAIGMTRS